MTKNTLKFFLDANFIIDVWSAEILDEFKSYAHMHNLHVIIPGEVYREIMRIDMSEFLNRMSLDKDKTLLEFPPLLEKDRVKVRGNNYMFGAGEEHIAIMAKWFKRRGQNVLVITSDKQAKKLLNHHKISNISMFGLLPRLNHAGLLPKDRVLEAVRRLEQSRSTMKADEKEKMTRQLR